jgi:ubiquinone/menaquinone biosynthesis C-methylase UbiE
VNSAPDSESKFFDQWVRARGDFNPFADRAWRTLAIRFEKMIQPRGGLRLLDIGCGTGQSRRLYASHCASYLGLDLSLEALRAARRTIPDVAWVRADARILPFASASFDVVAFSSVLHHIPDYTLALREAHRVLRPGGWAFAFDPNLLHPAMALFRHPSSPFYLSQGVSPHERPLHPAALRRAFAAAGFSDVKQRCQSDIPYRRVAPKAINACLAIYNAADWMWERSGLGRWLGTFVVTAAAKPVTPSK